MEGAIIETTGKVIWVCRENIGRSPVAEAFWQRDYPDYPTMSLGIDVSNPGKLVGDTGVADILIKTMQSEHDIDISNHMRRSLDDYSTESLGKAALIVILAEPQVVPPSLAMLPNALRWEMPDMKHTDPQKTSHIVNRILQSLGDIRKILNPSAEKSEPMNEQA